MTTRPKHLKDSSAKSTGETRKPPQPPGTCRLEASIGLNPRAHEVSDAVGRGVTGVRCSAVPRVSSGDRRGRVCTLFAPAGDRLSRSGFSRRVGHVVPSLCRVWVG